MFCADIHEAPRSANLREINMAANEDWKTEAFRAKVVSHIEEAVRHAISAGNSSMRTKNPSDMEEHLYNIAQTREDYMALVARLLVYIRDIQNVRLRPLQNVDQTSTGPGMPSVQNPQQLVNVQQSQLASQQAGGVAGPAVAQYPMATTQQIQNSSQVAASPAGPQSVPTPSTFGSIQSPASVYNPGSVGASVASPAPMNPADEDELSRLFSQIPFPTTSCRPNSHK